MAQYGKRTEPIEQPLCKTSKGLGIAIAWGFAGGIIAGGPIGGLIGIIASPIALWFFSDRGETILKDKHGKDLIINGKVVKAGPWVNWVALGAVAMPAIWIIGGAHKIQLHRLLRLLRRLKQYLMAGRVIHKKSAGYGWKNMN